MKRILYQLFCVPQNEHFTYCAEFDNNYNKKKSKKKSNSGGKRRTLGTEISAHTFTTNDKLFFQGKHARGQQGDDHGDHQKSENTAKPDAHTLSHVPLQTEGELKTNDTRPKQGGKECGEQYRAGGMGCFNLSVPPRDKKCLWWKSRGNTPAFVRQATGIGSK